MTAMAALGAIGGRPVEILALVFSAALFALGAFGPLILRRRENARKPVAEVRSDTCLVEPDRTEQPVRDRLLDLLDRGQQLHGAAQTMVLPDQAVAHWRVKVTNVLERADRGDLVDRFDAPTSRHWLTYFGEGGAKQALEQRIERLRQIIRDEFPA